MPNPNLPISGQYNTYIGARYVPVFATPTEWDNTKKYDPLTIVTHEGNSYTSKTYVPIGIDIKDETYWALTGNYNAQVEAYRKEVADNNTRVDQYKEMVDSYIDIITNVQDDIDKMRAYVTPEMFGAKGDGTTDDSDAIQAATNAGFMVGMPGKTYAISKEINIKNDTANMSFTYLKHDDTTWVVFSSPNTTHVNDKFEVPLDLVKTHTGRGSSITRVRADNIKFVGCKWTRSTNFVSMAGRENITFEHCYFCRAYETAYAEGGNGYAILLTDGNKNVLINNCIFQSIGRHCIYLSSDTYVTPNNNITISNCIFDQSDTSLEELPRQGVGTNTAINIRFTLNLVITNCHFYMTDGCVSIIKNEKGNVGNFEISNNTAYDICLTRSSFFINADPQNAEAPFNINFINNIIYGPTGVGIPNGTIKNNYIKSIADLYPPSGSRRGALTVYSSNDDSHCIIEGNTLIGYNCIICCITSNPKFGSLSFINNRMSINNPVAQPAVLMPETNLTFVDFVNNTIGENIATFTNTAPTVEKVRYALNYDLQGRKLSNWFRSSNVNRTFDDTFTEE